MNRPLKRIPFEKTSPPDARLSREASLPATWAGRRFLVGTLAVIGIAAVAAVGYGAVVDLLRAWR